MSGRRADAFVVLLVLLSSAAVLAQDCFPIDFPQTDPILGTDTRCHRFIDYKIGNGSTTNVTTLDRQAGTVTVPMPRCLYYAQLAFTCRKYFPKCTNTTVGGNNTLVPLCRTTCQAGQRWEFQSNVCYEDIVDEECAAVEFGAGPPPACYDYAFPEIDGGSAKWKWIVGGTMIGVGGLIGIWLLVQYIRKRRVNPEITDAVIDQPFKHEKAAIKRGTWTGAMPPVNSRPELVPTMGGSGAGDNSGAAYAAPAGGAHGHSGYAHQYGALPVAESTGAGGVYAPAPSAYAGAGYPSSASSSGAGAGAGAGTVGMGAGAGLGPGMGGPRPPHVSHGSAHVVGTGGAGYDIEMSQTDPSAPLRR